MIVPSLHLAIALLLPPASDIDLFPRRDVTAELLRVANARKCEGCPWAAFAWPACGAWDCDIAFCCRCWDTLDDAHRSFGDWQRRQHLARLRTLLGEDCYHTGAMPPPIPLCWWRRCD